MLNTNTKFLIVDDFTTMRRVIKKTLSDLGYQNIVEAVDGRNAYEILVECSKSNSPVEFIISDWNMPNMKGIEFLKKCRSEKGFEKIPFILVTAEDEQSKIIEAAKAGVTDYVIKPFSPAILKSKFSNYHKRTNSQEDAKGVA